MKRHTICTLLLVLMATGCSIKSKEAENAVDDEYPAFAEEAQAENLEDILAKFPEESFDERFESMNPWRKGYFKNEWDEDIPDNPYIYTILSGSPWDVRIAYESAQSSQTTSGVFGINIMDEHDATSIEGPVTILVRGSDGETKTIPVSKFSGGTIYIADPMAVESLKGYLNNDEFDILLDFEKYLERHKTKAHWWSDSGFFQRAIETML